MIRKTDPQAIAPYVRDASNFSGGQASEVVIPESVDELIGFLKSNRSPITVAGAGTGVTASRIPSSGIIISLERFKGTGDVENSTIAVEPAVSLAILEERLQATDYFYPPNPTEKWASLGGTIATNASGSRSYKFGSTRDYVLELGILLADGRSTHLVRGHKITSPLQLSDGSRIDFPHIKYRSPLCKNAAGYYSQPEMDWIDLFIGSDGTLGIVTRARLKLLPRPTDFISGVLFFDTEEACWRLVEILRAFSKNGLIDPCSLEYFDSHSLRRLKKKYENVPERAHASLFFEQDVAKGQDYDQLLEIWYEFLGREDVLLEDSWFARDLKDIRLFHELRHDLPLMLNEENSRLGRMKIGTDMAVSNAHFISMMNFYKRNLDSAGIDHAVFGHIGDNHLHINLLPEKSQMPQAQALYQTLVDQILQWKGTVSAEHGIGKFKKNYFAQMVGESALEELRRVKKTLDPAWILGVGNIL